MSPRLPSESVRHKVTTPAERLREEISELEKEMAESKQALADLETRMRATEARAMDAIHAGADGAARACLLEQQAQVEKAAELAADMKVVRAILDEFYEFTKTSEATGQ